MQLLHGWCYVPALNLPLYLYHSRPLTRHRFEKSWPMLWKHPVQLEGAIQSSFVNPGTHLLRRFLAASHQFYAQFYARNGHLVVPIHDATAL